jgi:tetratricopeptide (TPR) repeat protein
MLLVSQKNYTAALGALDRAIELGIATADVFQQRALCHQELDKLDTAINDLERALAIDPAHAVTLMTLGVISQKLGRFEAAIQFYTQAIELDPSRVEAYSNLGAVLFETNRPLISTLNRSTPGAT